jgi:tagaturonate reductase
VAELYALSAIEDQAGLELPCRHASITVAADLKPYERLKLFILNLGHTYLAEIWARGGGAPMLTVREAMADKALREELDDLYDQEVLPTFAGRHDLVLLADRARGGAQSRSGPRRQSA